MTGQVLKVDPVVLQQAGTAFGQAGDQLANLHAEAPLTDAAAAVPQLETAAACRNAESLIAAEVSSLADGARVYSGNLDTAAHHYSSGDQSAAANIASLEIPSPRS